VSCAGRGGWLLFGVAGMLACAPTDAGTSESGPESETGSVDSAGDTAPFDTSSDTGASGACADLAGSGWGSVDELECGLAPEGVALCHWRLSYTTDGAFTWRYSDVGEGGRWACAGETLTATTDGGRVLAATLVDAAHLDWEGVAYVRDDAR
jgi:hypothetical protein